MNKKIKELAKEMSNGWKKEFRPGIDLVPYSGAVMDEKEAEGVMNVLETGWMGYGSKSVEFEQKMAERMQRKYGLFCNSGSSANFLMAAAVKEILQKQGLPLNVITCVSGFPTTVNPWLQLGFKVKFVDCNLDDNYNIDLAAVEEELWNTEKEEYTVITFAHVLGSCVDMKELKRIVRQNGLIFAEDCCDALGSYFGDKALGSFGRFSTLSFFPAHHCTTGEGGMVFCDREDDYDLLKKLRDWGRSCNNCIGKALSSSKNGACGRRHSDWLNMGCNYDHRYVFDVIGYNFKSTEFNAAIGLAQINKLDKFEQIRKRNFDTLYDCLSKYEEYFVLPFDKKGHKFNWFAFPIRVVENDKFTRDDIVNFLEDKKVQTRLLFGGSLVRQPAYKKLGVNPDQFVDADEVLKNVFMLGVSQVITPKMMKHVCSSIDEFMTNLRLKHGII